MAKHGKAPGKQVQQKHSLRKPKMEFEPRVMYAALVASAVYVLLRVAAIVFWDPGDRVWGLDYARYILSWDVWVALLLPLVACVPVVAKAIATLGMAGAKNRRPVVYYTIGAVLTAGVVYLSMHYQVLYSFLGDGSYCHSEIYRVFVNPDMESQLFDKPTAWLTGQILRFMASTMEITDTRMPFLVLSVAGAIILIPGVFLLLRNERRSSMLLQLLVFVGTPAVLFFFGYIELYTIQYVFLALFFAASYSALRHNGSVVFPFVFLVLSIGFGGSSVVFLPAALFLAGSKYLKNEAHLRYAYWGLLSISVLVFAGLLVYQWDDMRSPYLIPLVAGNITREDGIMTGWFGYSMFSGAHLADVVNIVLFLGGAVFVSGIAVLVRGAGRSLWANRYVQFGAVSATAGALLVLGGNASFGLARDWDLAVIPMLGILIFCVAVLDALHDQKKIALPLLLPVLVLISLGTVYTWIGINAGPESAQRTEDIVDADASLVQPIITYTGYENIRKYYAHFRNNEQLARVLRKMLPTGWHTYLLFNNGFTLSFYLGSPERTREELEWYMTQLVARCRESYPENDYRYMTAKKRDEMLGAMLLYIEPSFPDITAKYAEIAHREIPSWKLYSFVTLAMDASIPKEELAQRTEGMVALDAEDPILLSRMGDHYLFAGNEQRGAAFYERAIEVAPHDYPDLYITLSRLYAGPLGQRTRAITTLERCLENCRLSPQVPEIKKMISALRQTGS